jgi:urease gamma subunit
MNISLKIDVTKIDKARLYKGKKGTYLDAVVFMSEETDQYGNDGMIVQSVSQEEREKGVRGEILGNVKKLGKPTEKPVEQEPEADDDLPF